MIRLTGKYVASRPPTDVFLLTKTTPEKLVHALLYLDSQVQSSLDALQLALSRLEMTTKPTRNVTLTGAAESKCAQTLQEGSRLFTSVDHIEIDIDI